MALQKKQKQYERNLKDESLSDELCQGKIPFHPYFLNG